MGKGRPRTKSVRTCPICFRDLTLRVGELRPIEYGGRRRFAHKDCKERA